MKKMLSSICIVAALLMGSQAHAGWIVVDDPDLTDDAINPAPANSAPAGPDNQSPEAVKTWLDDLINGDSGMLLDDGDSTPDVLTGLEALGAVYIVLHYGNYQEGDLSLSGNINIAYTCESDCDSFNPANRGLSNYRVYGVSVPEPGTLALITLGLAGLALRRKLAH